MDEADIRQRGADRLVDDAPVRLDGAMMVERAVVAVVIDAGGERDRPLHRLHDVGEADRGSRARASARPAAAARGAVLAGLAVSVLPESALRTGMRVLTQNDGFPALAPVQIGLNIGLGQTQPRGAAIYDATDACAGAVHGRIPTQERIALA